MRFYFIRHAESQNNRRELDDVSSNAKAKEGRSPDPSLTEQGVSQARNCAAALRPLVQEATPPEHRPRRVYTSLMRRTLFTAKPIAEALSLPLHGRADLHEEGGVFTGERKKTSEDTQEGQTILHGLTRKEVQALTPGIELGDEVDDSGWWRGGRETLESAYSRAARVSKWLHELAAASEAAGDLGAAIVVSHGLFLSRLFVVLLGCPLQEDQGSPAFMSMNCSLSVIDITGGRVGVFMLNSMEHMPAGSLRTGHHCLGFSLEIHPPYDGSCRPSEKASEKLSSASAAAADENATEGAADHKDVKRQRVT